MLTDKRRAEIHNAFNQEIEGGVARDMRSIVDGWIENFDNNEPYFKMSQEEWYTNEMEVCGIYDDGWFQCRDCSWNVPGDVRSMEDDECCTDCVPDQN